MSDQPNNPKKLKDLKARLGRTITPSTPKEGGGIAPPPNLGEGEIAPPPPGIGAPSTTPPAGVSPKGIVAPPMIQQQREAEARRKKAAAADPFASGSGEPVHQAVKIVIDDSAVDHAEVGRQQSFRNLLIISGGLVVGLMLGYLAGSMMGNRRTYNVTVQDGQAIYQTVRDASAVVEDVQVKVQAVASAAGGAAGRPPRVDYETITALRALEKPFEAHAFSRRNYNAFSPETVDLLFQYLDHVNQVWDQIRRLSNSVAGESRRATLDEAATAAGELSTGLTGCVPSIESDRFVCNMVFVTIEQNEDGTPKVLVRQNRRDRNSVEKQLYTGQRLDRDPSNYVILSNTATSMGVLGQTASAFAEFSAQVVALKALVDQTTEIQGRLEQKLGEVASMQEVFAL